jgi:glycerophosphoryl diester phosphodiesterase
MIVAHRGASKDAPENTIPAFQLAWKQNADAIEGDFLLTKDGNIVCIHDKTTKRTAGKELVVKDSTLNALKELDVGAYHGKEFKGITIPTIAEVLAIVPEGKKIYIEIKCGAEIIPALLDELKKSRLKAEQIVVICFNTEVIQELKSKAPQYKAYWLSNIRTRRSGKIKPSLETILRTLEEIKADGLSSSKSINEVFIKSVMEKGFEYHVWTIDDIETARCFRKWGAKSITTNSPEMLKECMVEQDAALDDLEEL